MKKQTVMKTKGFHKISGLVLAFAIAITTVFTAAEPVVAKTSKEAVTHIKTADEFTKGLPVMHGAKGHKLGNSSTNQMLGSITAEYKGRIYYAVQNSIYSVKKDGTGKKKIYTGKGKRAEGFSNIAVYNGYIYALYDSAEIGEGMSCYAKLVRMKLDGSGYKSYGYALGFAVADGRIYYTKAKQVKDPMDLLEPIGIYSMKLDGSKSKALVKKKGVVFLATDGKHIFYKVCSETKYTTSIFRCNMSGKNREKLLTTNNLSNYIVSGDCALSGDNLYFIESRDAENDEDEDTSCIIQYNMKTGEKTEVYTVKDTIWMFAVEGNTLYCKCGFWDFKLKKVNLSGKRETTLAKDVNIFGIHGDVIIYSTFSDRDYKETWYLARKSTGKKIKKIGTYKYY